MDMLTKKRFRHSFLLWKAQKTANWLFEVRKHPSYNKKIKKKHLKPLLISYDEKEGVLVKKNRMEDLLNRSERCCCKQCGGSLDIRIIVYNKYGGSGAELYCNHCQKIEYGTEPQIYKAAKAFVDRLGFNYFVDLEESERTYMLNIAKVCEILSWGTKYWGLLNKNGFTISLSLPADEEE